ncbi:MBL fold metallo-hydrolase [Sphingomonas sp. BK580]|uniref:MBL fold metallo-hydrolase n=1 Tax=Sphingomonas sp. BK580 TaxID=2586972 RepID=UPI001620D7ED|nr:MBL fold metallo-hydrolase [Sphingomonas sp. BK580]MBB3695156.1 glyoxylase-like metal-dependent hydrolase (beta-lactamase superfamily II) [Sphingomonas sp. BK580]
MKSAALLSALALSLTPSAQPASAQVQRPSTVMLQGADFYRFRVGAVTVTALSDGTVPQDLHTLLRSTTAGRTDALLRAGFLSNPVEASINAFLVQLPDRLVLVDTGSGELFGPGNGGKLVASLEAAGFRPEQITDILITHVHTDHSGGLVAGGRRVFANATLHVGQPDLDFFLDAGNAARSGYAPKYFEEAIKTVKPYVDAGKVAGFSGTTEVVPGITASLHPGHTPGSAFYTLESEGERIIFIGDIVHVAAVQMPRPEVTIVYDVDPGQAAAVRKSSFAEFARDRALVAAPHLPFPGVGHVRTVGTGYEFVPVDYGNRDAR